MKNYIHTGAIMKQEHKPDQKMTVRAVAAEMVKQRKRILSEKERVAPQRAEIFEVYAAKVAEEKTAVLENDLRTLISDEKSSARAAIAEMVRSKSERFSAVALSAPSEEQLRLLQTVAFRAESLTQSEVEQLCKVMAGNHQALRSLAALAAKAGITVSVPASVEDFEQELNELERYMLAMADALDKPDSSLNYNETAFFLYQNSERGYFKLLCETFDDRSYLAVQAKEKTQYEQLIEAENRALTAKDYEKSARIQKFLEENRSRLRSESELLSEDVAAVLSE